MRLCEGFASWHVLRRSFQGADLDHQDEPSSYRNRHVTQHREAYRRQRGRRRSIPFNLFVFNLYSYNSDCVHSALVGQS